MSSLERTIIEGIVKGTLVSPLKKNAPFEADCEILDLRTRPGSLAVTIDTVSEEFHRGAIRLPETLGWISVLASLTDLAAVGGTPIGALISISVPLADAAGDREGFRNRLIKGIQGCLNAHGVALLGGDLNGASSLKAVSVTSVALGTTPPERPLTRHGAKPGDLLYCSNGVGLGNLVAFANLSELNSGEAARLERSYCTRMNLDWSSRLGGCASACTDSSDGLIQSLKGLLPPDDRYGFVVKSAAIPYFPRVLTVASRFEMPRLAFAAGPMGDYGLLIAVPVESQSRFADLCRDHDADLRLIGSCVELPGIQLEDENAKRLAVPRSKLDELGDLDEPGAIVQWVQQWLS